MENKEEIKRIDGKYYLVRELETDGKPVKIDGEMMQPVKSIDDYDCQHCVLFDTDICGDPCSPYGFMVRVLPENSEEKIDEKLSNVEETGKNLETEKEETTMERKIGEIFEYNGEWYQCLKSSDGSCKHCDMNFDGKCPIPIKECTESGRSDNRYVIFKKLEKVGEPRKGPTLIFQAYKLVIPIDGDIPEQVCGYTDHIFNAIIGKTEQNKEDMEENKLNLKPFDLQKAKAGKPVRTRDGRKAKIICFDAKCGDTPIVALVEDKNGDESLLRFHTNGKYDSHCTRECDLMMDSVTKVGYINIYPSEDIVFSGFASNIYKSESKAKEKAKSDCVATIKIEWEE